MFPKETALRILQKCLSGKGKKIFRNQVEFYNAVFGVTNAEYCQENLIRMMLEPDGTQKDETIGREIDQFLMSGLDNSSSNIGKHINDEPRMPIPKQHCIHYSRIEKRKEMEHRLWAVIRYCASDGRTRDSITENDLQGLCRELKEKLAWASDTLRKTEMLDYRLLANIVYEIVQTHLGSRRRTKDLNVRTELPKKVDMNQQIREYYLTCDCYLVNSIDYYFALKRMSSKNVIASSNLGGYYYTGAEYMVRHEGSGNDGCYIVERNLDQAAYYFKCAADSEPAYAPAAYSIGYMYFHQEVRHMDEDEQKKLGIQYLRIAAEQNFHHAIRTLGDVALYEIEPVLERWEHGEAEHYDRIVEAVREALTQYDKGAEAGSIFGHSKVIELLKHPRFAPFMEDALKGLRLTGGTDIRSRWMRMAEVDNVWAMDELGLLEYESGNCQQAKAWFEKTLEYNYPEGAYHLAKLIYSPGGSAPAGKMYRTYLEKASRDGSAKASLELAKEIASRDLDQALIYLERATEQNYEKFHYDLYSEIREQKAKWKEK